MNIKTKIFKSSEVNYRFFSVIEKRDEKFIVIRDIIINPKEGLTDNKLNSVIERIKTEVFQGVFNFRLNKDVTEEVIFKDKINKNLIFIKEI